uniref:Uncharacterized protein n=1 Tax=Arundo donax TaxID=35708 RepID=A0A0A8Y6C0_ARUDO
MLSWLKSTAIYPKFVDCVVFMPPSSSFHLPQGCIRLSKPAVAATYFTPELLHRLLPPKLANTTISPKVAAACSWSLSYLEVAVIVGSRHIWRWLSSSEVGIVTGHHCHRQRSPLHREAWVRGRCTRAMVAYVIIAFVNVSW